MNKFLIILVLVAIATVEAQKKDKGNNGNGNDSAFKQWRQKFKGGNPKWESKTDESLERCRKNFQKRKDACSEHNAKADKTYSCGSNEFDHLDSDEVKGRLFGLRPPVESRALPRAPAVNAYSQATLPASVDWTTSCPPVYHQGSCGSCWAFASLSVIECWMKIKGTPVSSLSPQFLVDCDINSSNKQCNGGWPTNAFQNIITQFGTSVPTWANYNYTSYTYNATNTGYSACKSTIPRVPLKFTSPYQVNVNGNEAVMKYLVANYGPVAIGMYASSAFMSYKSGVFSDAACPTTVGTVNQCDFKNVNHAMVIVGYTTLNTIPVWIVRNSWGTGWGSAGYIYMKRDALNNCNPACFAMFVDN